MYLVIISFNFPIFNLTSELEDSHDVYVGMEKHNMEKHKY